MELKKIPVTPVVEKKPIRKILIKCPSGIDISFSLFPFLITLSEEYPKAEINMICEENTSLAYNFLPFKLRTFERPKDKLTLMQTHHFCANLNDIFNIDLFFDLENTFNSSFMGFNFRAIERVGYEVGMNKYFLTRRFIPELNLPIEVSSMKLLEHCSEKNFQDVKILKSSTEGLVVDNIEQLFKEPEPPKFIMVMLDNFLNVSKQIGLWTQFFDCFQNQKFIIWSLEDEDLISELFANIDLGQNNLYMHRGTNSKELVYLLNKVKGVVTNNLWGEGLCTYYGLNSLTFFNSAIDKMPGYEYFRIKPQRFIFSENAPIKYISEEETRELSIMNQVVDHIHFHFKL